MPSTKRDATRRTRGPIASTCSRPNSSRVTTASRRWGIRTACGYRGTRRAARCARSACWCDSLRTEARWSWARRRGKCCPAIRPATRRSTRRRSRRRCRIRVPTPRRRGTTEPCVRSATRRRWFRAVRRRTIRPDVGCRPPRSRCRRRPACEQRCARRRRRTEVGTIRSERCRRRWRLHRSRPLRRPYPVRRRTSFRASIPGRLHLRRR